METGEDIMFGKKVAKKDYDRENQRPVIHCSICTGEQIAGFKDLQTGRFEEIMLIKTEKDLKNFKEIYGISEISKEY
jgi:hypothetical protein